MATLYEISTEYANVLNNLEINEDGEIENIEELEKVQGEFKDKAEAVALYIKNLNSDADAIKEEADKLAERSKAKSNKADRLKKYLGEAMLSLDQTKIETPKVALSFRKSEKVNILDSFSIPQQYLTRKVEEKPNLTEIKKAIKEGKEVAGAELVVNQNIQIK